MTDEEKEIVANVRNALQPVSDLVHSYNPGDPVLAEDAREGIARALKLLQQLWEQEPVTAWEEKIKEYGALCQESLKNLEQVEDSLEEFEEAPTPEQANKAASLLGTMCDLLEKRSASCDRLVNALGEAEADLLRREKSALKKTVYSGL